MPAEWARHERTLMAWPVRAELWGEWLPAAEDEYAATANAIAAFEPVLMVAPPGGGDRARSRCAARVEVVEMPIDDSWLRDSGPVIVGDGNGRRVALDFGFNAWGRKFKPFDEDARVAGRIAAVLGLPARVVDIVLEGGSIAVDGGGTVLTTEQCLLHPNRNPGLDREQIEAVLLEALGATRVVWLGQGLVEDRDTDGHVDMIAAFLPSGRVLLQDAPPQDPNHEHCRENADRLRAAGFEVELMPHLAHVRAGEAESALSYMNHYVCNGGVILPLAGAADDDGAVETLRRAYPEHEVVGVPAGTIAFGGGGPHCITQQVPSR
ncbi:MAG: agmatine deiminase family protein [Actinobacteria bacterium]|nr:agmatine deiminase family protein [Actinomycetota bacterium]OJU80539.1 MAG: hypothetical protein BGO11_07375 [Solirubrobacterales bacterium 70-9]